MLHSDDQQGRRNEYSKLCVPIDMNETASYKDHSFVHSAFDEQTKQMQTVKVESLC